MYDIQTRRLDGPTFKMNCTACGGMGVDADSYQYGERVAILWVLPVSPYTEVNYVKCGRCREEFTSRIPVSELPYLEPDELAQLLRREVGLVPLFMAVVGLLFSVFPVVGLVLALISLVLNGWRKNHWTRVVSRVSVGIALVISALYGLLMLVLVVVGGVE